jgi:hypothetical protein
MRCPYRINTTKTIKPATQKIGDTKITAVEDFAECYELDCPLYNDEDGICQRIVAGDPI